MGKIIRRTVTVTLTLTETWTIVWSTEDDSLRSATRVVQEEQEATLRSAIVAADPGNQTATTRTAAPASNASTGGMSACSTDGSKRKRTRARRVPSGRAGNPGSQ